MAVETDERGRLYLPKDLREKHGERFRIVDLPHRLVLIPIADDPLQAVRDSIGDQFADRSLRAIRRDAQQAVAPEVDAEVSERERRDDR